MAVVFVLYRTQWSVFGATHRYSTQRYAQRINVLRLLKAETYKAHRSRFQAYIREHMSARTVLGRDRSVEIAFVISCNSKRSIFVLDCTAKNVIASAEGASEKFGGFEL